MLMVSLQNVIAIVYDCDKTLIPNYMQKPLFEKFNINENQFWNECSELTENYAKQDINLDDELAYLNNMLRYVKSGKMKNLSNQMLFDLGKEIELFPGIPDYFQRTKDMIEEDPKFKQQNITLEHYIITTGLKPMVQGNRLNSHLTDIFASEFIEDENGQISEIARAVGYTNKTRFLYEINKGCNVNKKIDVNMKMPDEMKRIPFENMIYIGDGQTDVPCFSTLNSEKGTSLAVYHPDSKKAFKEAFQLRKEGRVVAFAEADYCEGSHLSRIIESLTSQIANKIVDKKEREFYDKISLSPTYG